MTISTPDIFHKDTCLTYFDLLTNLLVSCVIFFSRDDNDTEKLNISNGCATEKYLTNSRRVRNGDKPVENNVSTGRLPVSTRTQHRQQQQHC